MSGEVRSRKLMPHEKLALDWRKKAKRRALWELAKNHRPEYQALVAKHLKEVMWEAEEN